MRRVENLLLRALPDESRAEVLAAGDEVSLPAGYSLLEADASNQFMYFPEWGLAMFRHPIPRTEAVGGGVIGYEGMVGLAAFLAPGIGPIESAVQIPITAWRIPTGAMARLCRRDRAFDALLKAYAAARLQEMGCNITCEVRHPVPARLARLLLTVQDRLHANAFVLTQQTLATLVVISRQRLNGTATEFRDTGLIEYGRSHITILDRTGLEALCCPCYFLVRSIYRTIGLAYAT